jgi:hypothetical protein
MIFFLLVDFDAIGSFHITRVVRGGSGEVAKIIVILIIILIIRSPVFIR